MADLNVKIKAILDSKSLQTDLSKIQNLNADVRLGVNQESISNLQTKLNGENVFVKVKAKLDTEAFKTFKESLSNKSISVKVKTKLDTESFGKLKQTLENKNVSMKVKANLDEAAVKQVGEKAGKTVGSAVGKSLSSAMSKEIKADEATQAKLQKLAQSMGKNVDKNFFGNAKTSYTFNKDDEGVIKSIIMQGERADGVIKKLTFDVEQFKNRLGNDKTKISLISEKETDKTEKALAKITQQAKEFRQALRQSGDTKLLTDLDSLEKRNQLDRESLQILKNRFTRNEELRRSFKEQTDIENKRLGLIQKINIARQEGRLSAQKEAELMKQINTAMEKSTNKKTIDALKGAEKVATREIQLHETVMRHAKQEEDAIAKKHRQEEKFLRDKMALLERVDRLRLNTNNNMYSQADYSKHLASLNGMDTSKSRAALQEIQKEITKIEAEWKKVQKGFANNKSIEDLKKSFSSLQPYLVNASTEVKRLADDIQNRLAGAKSRQDIMRLQSDVKNLGTALKETVQNAKAGENIKFGRNLDGVFGKHKQDIVSFNREMQNFFRTMHGGDAVIVGAKNSISKYGHEMTNFKVQIQNGKKYVQEFSYALNHSNKELIRNGMELKNNVSKNLGVLEQLKVALERVPVYFASTTAFYGSIEGLKALSREVIELDKALTELKRVAADGTDVEILFRGAISMASELGNNAKDVLATVSEISRSYDELSEQQQLSLARASTVIANVSDMKANDAMKALIATMNGYRMETTRAMEIGDKLNEVDNNNSISTQQLAESMQKASATANTFGVDLDQLLGHTTAIGATTQESGRQIGNALKTIYSRVTTLEDVESILKSVGIGIRDVAGDALPVQDVFAKIAEKWQGMTNMERQNIAVKVAGRNHLTKFLALMNNWDMSVKATTDSLNSQGSAMKENARYQESLEARLNRLKNTFSSMALSFGDAVLNNGLIVLMDTVQGAMTGISALASKLGIIPVVLAAVGAAIVAYQMKVKSSQQLQAQSLVQAEKMIQTFRNLGQAIKGVPNVPKINTSNLKEIDRDIGKLKKSVADVRTEYANTAEKTAELTQKTKETIAAKEKQIRTLQQERQHMQVMREHYSRLGESVKKYENVVKLSEQSGRRLNASLLSTKANMLLVGTQAQLTSAKIRMMQTASNMTNAAVGVLKTGLKGLAGFMATAFLPTVAFMAVGWAIEKVINKVGQYKQEQERLKQENERLIETFSTQGTEIGQLVDKYTKLSKAVSDGKISKSNKEFLEVQKKLSQLMPDLVEYTDEAGNAHLKSADAVKVEYKEKKKLYDLEKQSKIKEYTSDLKLSIKAINEKQKAYKDLTKAMKEAEKEEKKFEKKSPKEKERYEKVEKSSKYEKRGSSALSRLDAKTIEEATNKTKKYNNAVKEQGKAAKATREEINNGVKVMNKKLNLELDDMGVMGKLTKADKARVKSLQDVRQSHVDLTKTDADKFLKSMETDSKNLAVGLSKIPPVTRKIFTNADIERFALADESQKGMTETQKKSAEAGHAQVTSLGLVAQAMQGKTKEIKKGSEGMDGYVERLKLSGMSEQQAKQAVEAMRGAIVNGQPVLQAGADGLDEYGDAADEAEQQISDLEKAINSVTTITDAQANQNKEAIAIYETFAGKTNLTAQQQDLLKAAQDQLINQFPDLYQNGQLKIGSIREEMAANKEITDLINKRKDTELTAEEETKLNTLIATQAKIGVKREEITTDAESAQLKIENTEKAKVLYDQINQLTDGTGKLSEADKDNAEKKEALKQAYEQLGTIYPELRENNDKAFEQAGKLIEADSNLIGSVQNKTDVIKSRESDATQTLVAKSKERIRQLEEEARKTQELTSQISRWASDISSQVSAAKSKAAEAASVSVPQPAAAPTRAKRSVAAPTAYSAFSSFMAMPESSEGKGTAGGGGTGGKSGGGAANAPTVSARVARSAPTFARVSLTAPTFTSTPMTSSFFASPASFESSAVEGSITPISRIGFSSFASAPVMRADGFRGNSRDDYKTDFFDMASNALDTRKGLMEAQLERVIKLSGQYRGILEKIAQIERERQQEVYKEAERLQGLNAYIRQQLAYMGDINRLSEEQREKYNQMAQELDENTKKINDFRVEVENITNTINNLRTEQAQNAIEEIRKKYTDVIETIRHEQTSLNDYMIEYINLADEINFEDHSGSVVGLEAGKLDYLEKIRDYYAGMHKELEWQLQANVGNQEIVEDLTAQVREAEAAWRDVNLEILNTKKNINDVRGNVADKAIALMQKYYEKSKELALRTIEEEKKAQEKAYNERMKQYDSEIEKLNKVYESKLKQYDDANDETDWNSGLNDLNGDKSKILHQLDSISLDNSMDAKKKRDQLLKQLAEKELEIATYIRDRERELTRKAIEEQQQAELEALEAKKQADEEAYEKRTELLDQESERIAEVYDKIIDNEEKWTQLREEFIKGNFETIRTELETMSENLNDFTTGKFQELGINMESLSQEVKDQMIEIGDNLGINFVDKLQEVLKLINDIKTASSDMGEQIKPPTIEPPKPPPPPPPPPKPPTPPPPVNNGGNGNGGQNGFGSIPLRKKDGGFPVPRGGWDKYSVVDYLKKKGYWATWQDTVNLHKYFGGGDDYRGSASQNTFILNKLRDIMGFRTGGYTGEWFGDGGRLAMLHQKELVLNQGQTRDILDTANIVKEMSNTLPNLPKLLKSANGSFANGNGVKSGNTYNLKLNIGTVTGDKKGGETVFKEIVNGMKRLGG
ncbi:phage tail tape measure protein [Bacillus thuringiensis]|uniref:phage tail tape measure protein n=1 Tax=Bacillus thuringiensis TaxID=1428 RepID=UPI003F5BF4EF